MMKKPKRMGEQYKSEMARNCEVIHSILGKASYDVNIGGLVRYSPPSGMKSLFYRLGYARNREAYLPDEKARALDAAVQALVETYERYKSESAPRKKRKPTMLGLLSSIMMKYEKR